MTLLHFGDQRLPDAFWDRVQPEPNSGCWLWAGAANNGYGRFTLPGTMKVGPTHRIAYEALIGRVAPTLSCDHLCRNRACCNPAHIEPVSNAVNVLRGVGVTAQNSRKTHCIHGHEFTEANIYRTSYGHRGCRQCKMRHSKAQAAQKYAERRARGLPKRATAIRASGGEGGR